jgi:hypothetical protein
LQRCGDRSGSTEPVWLTPVCASIRHLPRKRSLLLAVPLPGWPTSADIGRREDTRRPQRPFSPLVVFHVDERRSFASIGTHTAQTHICRQHEMFFRSHRLRMAAYAFVVFPGRLRRNEFRGDVRERRQGHAAAKDTKQPGRVRRPARRTSAILRQVPYGHLTRQLGRRPAA